MGSLSFYDSTQKIVETRTGFCKNKAHSEERDSIWREEECEEGGVARRLKKKRLRCVLRLWKNSKRYVEPEGV